MFRLTFVLLAGIWVAMVVGGRDPGEAGHAGQVSGAAAPADPGPGPAIPGDVVAAARSAPPADLLIEPPGRVGAAAQPAAVRPGPAARPVAEAAAGTTPAARQPRFLSVDQEVAAALAPAEAAPQPGVPIGEGAAAAPAEPQIRYVVASRVNVRSGPSTDFDVVGQLSFGDAAEILSDPADGWVRVRIEDDGIEGFIAARFLQEDKPSG